MAKIKSVETPTHRKSDLDEIMDTIPIERVLSGSTGLKMDSQARGKAVEVERKGSCVLVQVYDTSGYNYKRYQNAMRFCFRKETDAKKLEKSLLNG